MSQLYGQADNPLVELYTRRQSGLFPKAKKEMRVKLKRKKKT